MSPRASAAPLALLALALAPAAAQATTQLELDAGSTAYVLTEASPGADRVTITQQGATIVFTGEAAIAELVDGCQGRSGTGNRVVECVTSAASLDFRPGTGDDRLVVEASVTGLFVLDANGGAGADTLINRSGGFAVFAGGDGPDLLEVTGSAPGQLSGGSPFGGADDGAPDVLRGGSGSDGLSGGGGADELRGGGGDDQLNGGPGADVLDGGDGVDGAGYFTSIPGVAVRLAAGAALGAGGDAEGDQLSAMEDLIGGPARDVLEGDDGANRIFGGFGLDTLTGGGGVDDLQGGGDADTIDAADGGGDRVDCGGDDADTVRFDRDADAVFGCPDAGRTAVEPPPPPTTTQTTTVTTTTTTPADTQPVAVTPGGPPAIVPAATTDTTRPGTAGTFPGRVRLSTLRRRGYAFTVRAGETATVGGVLTTRPRSVRFGGAAAGDLELGSVTGRAANGTVRLTVRVARRYRAALRRGQSLRLALTITDAAGNRALRSVRVRLT